MKNNLLFCTIKKLLLVLLIGFSAVSQAKKPTSPVTLGASPYALDVTINEIGINDSFLELYFHETTDISGWSLFYEGQGNISGSIEICNGTLTSNPASANCGTYSAGSFLQIANIPFHPTLQEVLLIDNNAAPPSGDVVVHYFRYANSDKQAGGQWKWDISDTSIATIYYANGDKTNLCTKPDGSITTGNWQECSSTPGSSNAGDIDHYEIIHDGSGLTCDAETVTIKACTNSDCTTLSDDSISLEFQGDGTTISSQTFTGSTSFNFSHTLAETLTLSVATPSISPTNALVCDDGGSTNCDIVFADTGFRFLVNGSVASTPTQLSAKPSNTGYNAAVLSLQAIKTNSETGACEAALSSEVNIELVAECINPTSCAGQQVTINNGTVDTLIATQNSGSSLTYNNVSMDFGSNTDNSADFIFTYPDAGSIKLYARHNILVDGSPSGNYMSGASNFVVRPLGFYVDVAGNPAATDHEGAVFKKAGENFNTTVTAVQWATGDDVNEDGIPDNNAALSNNAATPNFGNENSAESVIISHALVLPSVGNNPPLSANSFTSFSNGVSPAMAINWPEVGIISFTAGLPDSQYIGSSNVSGTVPYVGRFTPDHFQLAITKNGELNGGNPFVYSGQMKSDSSTDGQISYATLPTFTITAKSLTGSTTLNYTGDFMKLQADDIIRVVPSSDADQEGVDGTKVNLTAELNDVILVGSNGVLNYQFNSTDNFVYTRNANAIIAPFSADIDLQISSITDSDGITANDTDSDTTNGVLTLQPAGVEIRFGRWVMENSYGPETSALRIPMQVQYWDGSRFATNTSDSFTAFSSSSATITNVNLAPATTTASGSGSFVDGETKQLMLSSPGVGKRGSVNVEFIVPSWLKFDWDNDGAYNDKPSALATFGLYRGNDRIIYRREVFQ